MAKKSTVSFPDFQKLDFRVGKVVEAEPVKNSKNLIKLKVDLGKDYGKVQILSGIANWYQVQDLEDRKFIFIANLEPRKMMGMESQGMILCADTDGKAVIIPVSDDVKEGTIVR